jgi:hypothetical protein
MKSGRSFRSNKPRYPTWFLPAAAEVVQKASLSTSDSYRINVVLHPLVVLGGSRYVRDASQWSVRKKFFRC